MNFEIGQKMTETKCPACGGTVDMIKGRQNGHLPVGTCKNQLETGYLCNTRFTLSRSAEMYLNQTLNKESNDNAEVEEDATESKKRKRYGL